MIGASSSMRWFTFIFAVCACAICGCATRPSTQPVSVDSSTVADEFADARVASALLFDPPVISNQPMPDLSRDGREVTAFLGYDSAMTTSFYVRTNDRQFFDDPIHGRFERQAISETVGVRSR